MLISCFPFGPRCHLVCISASPLVLTCHRLLSGVHSSLGQEGHQVQHGLLSQTLWALPLIATCCKARYLFFFHPIILFIPFAIAQRTREPRAVSHKMLLWGTPQEHQYSWKFVGFRLLAAKGVSVLGFLLGIPYVRMLALGMVTRAGNSVNSIESEWLFMGPKCLCGPQMFASQAWGM